MLPGARKPLRYLMVGACCALLNLLIQNGAILILGFNYVTAALTSFLILTPLSYALHATITFNQKERQSLASFARYALQCVALLGANILLMALLVEVLGLHINLAICVATVMLHVIGYLSTRYFVFGRAKVGRSSVL
jgi:putative flippase GtrA